MADRIEIDVEKVYRSYLDITGYANSINQNQFNVTYPIECLQSILANDASIFYVNSFHNKSVNAYESIIRNLNNLLNFLNEQLGEYKLSTEVAEEALLAVLQKMAKLAGVEFKLGSSSGTPAQNTGGSGDTPSEPVGVNDGKVGGDTPSTPAETPAEPAQPAPATPAPEAAPVEPAAATRPGSDNPYQIGSDTEIRNLVGDLYGNE